MADDKMNLPKELFDDTPLVPTKVFDNLYCIGSKSVVSWIINTSEGIVLLDSMWDNRDGQLILDGMKKLSLDASKIKYVVVSHGHGDHYGGAQYIKDKCNAEIIMSEIDKDFMNEVNSGANGPRSPKCSVDILVDQEMELCLGDTCIDLIMTPGHTPGCLSAVFNVKEKGEDIIAALWGGTGFPAELKWKEEYKKSVHQFAEYLSSRKASSIITAHLFAEDGYEKLADARENKDPNPFICGAEGIKEYFENLDKKVSQAIRIQKEK